jgi:peptidyl-prolyl cis-trans isomerase A (cyclophilin A)
MRLALCVFLSLFLAACGGGPGAEPKKAAPGKTAFKDGPMPDVWRALFDTSKGSFVVEVHKDWAPKGAEHFWMLVNSGFFNDTRIFRVRPDFIVQFGLSGDPLTNSLMNAKTIDDDPVKEKNVKGAIAFAQAGKRSRHTQVFVNLKDNSVLDKDGFAPFGKITQGMDVFEKLYSGYGEWDPPGHGPSATRIQTQGNAYLDAQFPRLDKILRAKAVR